MAIYYYAIKFMFLFGLVKPFIKFEPLQKHFLFLGLLYTAGIALLSWVFLVAPGTYQVRPLELAVAKAVLPSSQLRLDLIALRTWQIWLVETFALFTLYLWLLARFDEGGLFWLILIAGFGLVLF